MHNSRYKKASSRITRRSELKRTFGLILKIGLPIAFLIGLVWLLRADFLQVKNFEVLGLTTLSEQNVKSLASDFATGTRLFLIPKSNILFINKKDLANVLLNNFNQIEKVEVNKKFFSHQVQLKVAERKPEFLWCSQNKVCYFMTSNGLVFEKTENTKDKLIFEGVLTGDPLMQYFATPTQIQNYLKLVEVFKKAGFAVASFNIESADKATAQTDLGVVIFNPDEVDLSLVAQNVLLLVNETKIKNPSARFQYIDARFGNKMYYKTF
ncbi:MAG: hypothetical protein WC657_01845 [Candidatus Paceibacterota bacterium]|jgi:cell division septal protein FtsQ